MRARLPPLNSLRLFEASARLLSFKNAAEELLLTPSAVSHGIQSLEEWLGASLFLRTTKGLVLSEAGMAYFPIVQQALDLLASGSAKIASPASRGQLAISAAPTFAARWLLPRLHQFRGPPSGNPGHSSIPRMNVPNCRMSVSILRSGWEEATGRA